MAEELVDVNEQEISNGVENLRAWIDSEAVQIQEQIGIGWVVDEIAAPTNYPDLMIAYWTSLRNRSPFPVAESGSHSSMYGLEVNSAFRFVHDVTHARLQQDFSPIGELRVAADHLTKLTEYGCEFGGLEWQILFADTVGQVIFNRRYSGFVDDQRLFVNDMVARGIEMALRLSRTA